MPLIRNMSVFYDLPALKKNPKFAKNSVFTENDHICLKILVLEDVPVFLKKFLFFITE